MQVLIADNNLDHRIQLADQLAGLGHNVVESVNEQNILKICKNKCPDLLLIDSQLNSDSGIELVYKIRQLGGSSVWNTIILMANTAAEFDMQRGLEYGADDFLLKPISNFQLLYKLATAKRHQELKADIFEMAHDLAVANRALENVNKQDVMTGICDTNTFYRNMETEWYKSRKDNYDLVLILLNLDYFRAYNEVYGSESGDQIIKQIAQKLKNALPAKYNNIARTAGETFAILLPKETIEFALQLANNLVNLVANLQISHRGSACSNVLTISAGVAITDPTMQNYLELIELADYGLYKAKHSGRNRACLELKLEKS